MVRRRLLTAVAAVALVAAAAVVAGNVESRRPIGTGSLPQAARTFLGSYYPDESPALCVREFEDLRLRYEVVFIDGTKVKFFRDGALEEVKSRTRPVPAALIPESVAEYVGRNFPGSMIIEVEMSGRETEVKLDNRVELTFDSKTGALLDFDD